VVLFYLINPRRTNYRRSLSMSALQGTDECKPMLSSIDTGNRFPPSAATPVPATASVDSRPAADWTVNPSQHTLETEFTPSLPPSEPQVTNNSSERIQNGRLPPSSLASAMSLSPRHQRSISALTYPTRPAEISSSAKRMKQLALLESVVDESARLTPTIEQQRAILQGPMFNPAVPMISRSAAASVPPHNTMSAGLVPGSVLYSSDGGSGFPPRVQSIPPPINGVPPPLCSTLRPDPFTVRPRPLDGPLMNPTPLHTSNGLLSGVSGGYTQAVPPPPHLHPVPQYNQQIPGPLTSNVPPFPRHVGNQPFPGQYGGRMPFAHNSLGTRPQSAVPYPSMCPPVNTPGIGPQSSFPGFSPQLSQPKGNPQLLSILNNRGPGVAGLQTSMIPPVGNLTSFQPR
jgi:mRNA-decapping enzyme subunit 2